MVHAQKITADTVRRFQRAEVLLIIFVKFAAEMQPNLVQHPGEINHAARHFLWTLWIGSHRRMNRIIRWRRNSCSSLRDQPSTPEFVLSWRRNRVNETAGFHRGDERH